MPPRMSHGDFTPSNTFTCGHKLYVFDWEYSDDCWPLSNDLIHFGCSDPKFRSKPLAVQHAYLEHLLGKTFGMTDKEILVAHLLVYFLGQAAFHMGRMQNWDHCPPAWEGESYVSAMIDKVLE